MMWWPPYRRRVLAEADEYLESFGNLAYSEVKKDENNAWDAGYHDPATVVHKSNGTTLH